MKSFMEARQLTRPVASLLSVRSGLRVLVTGSTGFLGRAVATRLARDHDVRAFTRSHGGDVLDIDAFERAASECDAIVHLAGKSRGSLFEVFQNNVTGTLNAAEVAKRTNASLVFASSAAAYDPSTPYGASKALAERMLETYAREADVATAILRIFNPFGEGDSKGVIARYLQEDTVRVHGDFVRDFVHVDDVANAIALSLRPEGCFKSDVGSGRGTRIRDLAKWFGKPVDVDESESPTRIAESIARNVAIPDWRASIDVETWVRARVAQASSSEAS